MLRLHARRIAYHESLLMEDSARPLKLTIIELRNVRAHFFQLGTRSHTVDRGEGSRATHIRYSLVLHRGGAEGEGGSSSGGRHDGAGVRRVKVVPAAMNCGGL